ncbi:hypothetical protein HMPREF1546_02860 [Oscillibacter sp. KLE 1745]|nr:hypothetical protein HMPREF1546_02860 [Oscillibacter sp. KLE 1745]
MQGQGGWDGKRKKIGNTGGERELFSGEVRLYSPRTFRKEINTP